MVKLGEFAAGAAHEMNNPLTVISGRAQLLAATASSDVDRAASAAIVDGAERLSDLITSLRLIADPPKPRLESTSFDAIVRAAIASGQERAGTSGKGITVRLPSPAPALLLDRPMVASSLAELIANAIQASPDTPITIEAQTDPVDGRSLFVVTDQGPGMSPKALQHAFDPFFSEKQAGRRTGLGLTRARTLVEAHGGEIHLRSAPGEGTVATIALPAHQTAARAQ
jgi:signal transduction histidine kinase